MIKNNPVLEPWSPIEFTIGKNNANAKVWGRRYAFESSLFPTTVQTAGNDILAAPIKLHAFLNGKEEEFTESVYFILEQTNAKVVFNVSQTAGNIICDGRISIEYDGFIQIAFSIIPYWEFAQNDNNVPSLDKLYIDIPVKKEFASLYHYWPNSETSIIPDQDIINSGALPNEGVTFPFKPYIWLGWEYGGIGICSENDRNLELNDKKKAIECIKNNDNVTIRLHLLDHIPESWQGRVDKWTDTLKPIDYIFGLQATPVKAFPKNLMDEWRVYHYGYKGAYSLEAVEKKDPSTGLSLMDELVSSGVKWILLHEIWSVIQNYGLPENETEIKQLINEFHKNNIRVLVYFGYEYSTLAPDWYEKASQYLIQNVNGEYTGGWQRQPHQRAFMACYKGGYAEVMQDRISYIMDEYGVDGIYTDGTYVPWECANRSHQCGCQDKEGKLHTTFPIFAVREHVKKLYDIVHERGGVIDTHQSSCCLAPTLAFCDSYYDGENIQSAMQKDMKFLRLDAFKAEYMGKNLGIPAQFIASTNQSGFTIQKISSITLLHDVHPRASNITDLKYLSAVWNIFSDFGTDCAKWYPYWEENSLVKILCDKAYCSVYEKDNELLVVVTSIDDKIDSVELSVAKSNFTAQNAFSLAALKVTKNRVSLPINCYDAQIVYIKAINFDEKIM